MTVGELIDELRRHPADMPVVLMAGHLYTLCGRECGRAEVAKVWFPRPGGACEPVATHAKARAAFPDPGDVLMAVNLTP